MQRKFLTVFVILGATFLLSASLFPKAGTLGKVIAYPNPFKPYSDTLTVRPEASAAFSGVVQYYIYNYNEKEVYKGSVSNSAITWSGFLSNGSPLSPGLYYIKIVQTDATGTASTMVKLVVQ